ncbi:hypothetical protein [Peribacillus asahii]|uniref:Uncharacterized protein n=1 Tax=Peribacillus asahii TaxID=228899 RepID=A0A3Q9RM92_9BACI|nr:hypothetical protein [Peribacillus asahii]AZV42850.1 hypothetical protein BAOM_2241 [Peribacillus asahii]USK87083.1 hypothetical protein LIT35_10825 [Peribacillus asahii]
MLLLPIHFDENEWFVLIALLPLILGFIVFRKVLPSGITVAVLLYFASIGKWTDYVIGIKFQQYLALDTFKQDLFDWLCLGIAYPLFGYFFVYILVRRELKGIFVSFYILVWSVILVFSEWVASLFNVFVYMEWNLMYSFVVYLLVLTLGFFYLKVIQRCYCFFIQK